MATAGQNTIEVSFQDNGVAVIRMRRGENRINEEFLKQFNCCLDTVERNPTCRGLVTTGEGKFYSNGLDTAWMATQGQQTLVTFMNNMRALQIRLLTFPLPTVAAINGHCYAGGALIAYSHDFRVMNSERGWLCFNEVFINRRFNPLSIKLITMKIGAGPTLLRAVVLGQQFTGPEAERAGMVDAAVAPSDVLQHSHSLLDSFLGKHDFPRDGLRNMKMDVYGEILSKL